MNLQAILKAMSDGTRLKIIEMLLKKNIVSELFLNN